MQGGVVFVAVAAVVSVMAVSIFVVLLRRIMGERKRLAAGEVIVKASPLSAMQMNQALERRVEALKLFYEQMYYTCDNFPKYAGKMQDYFVENYHNGGIRDFAADIVYATDVARNGAITRMAMEYGLTDLETRTCCFLYLGFTWQQTCAAELLTENAYSVRCSRIRKKLRLEKDDRIPDFIKRYCAAHSIPSAQ